MDLKHITLNNKGVGVLSVSVHKAYLEAVDLALDYLIEQYPENSKSNLICIAIMYVAAWAQQTKDFKVEYLDNNL